MILRGNNQAVAAGFQINTAGVAPSYADTTRIQIQSGAASVHIDILNADIDLNSNYIDGFVTAATCTKANEGFFKIKVGGVIKRVSYFDDA
jgi:hypothetical protein